MYNPSLKYRKIQFLNRLYFIRSQKYTQKPSPFSTPDVSLLIQSFTKKPSQNNIASPKNNTESRKNLLISNQVRVTTANRKMRKAMNSLSKDLSSENQNNNSIKSKYNESLPKQNMILLSWMSKCASYIGSPLSSKSNLFKRRFEPIPSFPNEEQINNNEIKAETRPITHEVAVRKFKINYKKNFSTKPVEMGQTILANPNNHRPITQEVVLRKSKQRKLANAISQNIPFMPMSPQNKPSQLARTNSLAANLKNSSEIPKSRPRAQDMKSLLIPPARIFSAKIKPSAKIIKRNMVVKMRNSCESIKEAKNGSRVDIAVGTDSVYNQEIDYDD